MIAEICYFEGGGHKHLYVTFPENCSNATDEDCDVMSADTEAALIKHGFTEELPLEMTVVGHEARYVQ